MAAVLKIWQALKIIYTKRSYLEPLLEIENDGFIVATGNETAIKILELQPSGKKRMSAEQFLRGAGAHLTKGIRLGDHHEK